MADLRRYVVDWVELFTELRRRGFTSGSMGPLIGVSANVIREYWRGEKTPLHSNGEKIIAFWCDVTGRTREELPMTPEMPRHVVR